VNFAVRPRSGQAGDIGPQHFVRPTRKQLFTFEVLVSVRPCCPRCCAVSAHPEPAPGEASGLCFPGSVMPTKDAAASSVGSMRIKAAKALRALHRREHGGELRQPLCPMPMTGWSVYLSRACNKVIAKVAPTKSMTPARAQNRPTVGGMERDDMIISQQRFQRKRGRFQEESRWHKPD